MGCLDLNFLKYFHCPHCVSTVTCTWQNVDPLMGLSNKQTGYTLYVMRQLDRLLGGVGGGVCGTVPCLNFKFTGMFVSRFEEYAMSMSLFSPSLCRFSLFHLIVCRCFKAMSH